MWHSDLDPCGIWKGSLSINSNACHDLDFGGIRWSHERVLLPSISYKSYIFSLSPKEFKDLAALMASDTQAARGCLGNREPQEPLANEALLVYQECVTCPFATKLTTSGTIASAKDPTSDDNYWSSGPKTVPFQEVASSTVCPHSLSSQYVCVSG